MGNFVNDKDLISDEVLEINLHRSSYQFTDNQWGCLSQRFASMNTPVLMESSGLDKPDKVVGLVIAIQRIDSQTNKIRLLFWPRFTNCLTSDLRITNLEFNDNNMLCAIYVGVKLQNE